MRKYAVSIVMGTLLLAGGRALAEEDTIAALRKACQKELTTFCKGVPEGEGRVLACFYAFQDKVSDKCMYALYDASAQLEHPHYDHSQQGRDGGHFSGCDTAARLVPVK